MKEQPPGSQETSQQKFDRVLRGNFDFFPRAKYATTLPDIDAISIFQTPPKEKSPVASSLAVVLFYNINDKPIHTTLSLTKEGQLIGDIPRGLKVTKDEIKSEILSIAEQVRLKFFTPVDGDILPPFYDESEELHEEKKKKDDREREEKIDPRRIALLIGRPDSLFGIYDKFKGLDGHAVFFYKDYLVIEHKKVGNALYIYKFAQPIEVDQGAPGLPPENRVTDEVRERIINQQWTFRGVSLSEFKKRGGKRVVHPRMDDPDWAEKMNKKIEEAIRGDAE